MHTGASLWIFIVTITALACTPGVDTLYIVTRGIGEGRRIALLSAGGVCLGYVGYALLAALGVSAVIAPRPWPSTYSDGAASPTSCSSE